MSMVFCRGCAKEIHESAVSCPHCGAVQNVRSASMEFSPKRILPLAVVCFFLGMIGIHRFMVGKIGTGIVMILLCWTGISFVWAVIDFIMILCGSFTDKAGNKITQWS